MQSGAAQDSFILFNLLFVNRLQQRGEGGPGSSSTSVILPSPLLPSPSVNPVFLKDEIQCSFLVLANSGPSEIDLEGLTWEQRAGSQEGEQFAGGQKHGLGK